MLKRVATQAVAAVSEGAHPLAQLPPTFQAIYLVELAQPTRARMSDESKPRVHLPPGTYRITANIALEANLSEDQLANLFVRLRDAGVPVTALPVSVPQPQPQEAAYEPVPYVRPELTPEEMRHAAQVQELLSEYKRLLGAGPDTLDEAVSAWLREFGEVEVIRDAFEDVARMRFGAAGTKYVHVKEELRKVRIARMRGALPPRGGR